MYTSGSSRPLLQYYVIKSSIFFTVNFFWHKFYIWWNAWTLSVLYLNSEKCMHPYNSGPKTQNTVITPESSLVPLPNKSTPHPEPANVLIFCYHRWALPIVERPSYEWEHTAHAVCTLGKASLPQCNHSSFFGKGSALYKVRPFSLNHPKTCLRI